MKKKYKYTKETKRKMKKNSMGNKYALGNKQSENNKEKLRLKWLGDKNPMKKEANKRKISEFNKRWHKEIGHSNETIKIKSEMRLGK